MGTKILNQGKINGNVTVRMTVNIYADSIEDIRTPDTGDILINQGKTTETSSL
ncbi:MAG: hypothetical protein IJS39_06060 [Synergistaceae bacterium]|nr:hypothetical protein [Synergistaceae bacterium]